MAVADVRPPATTVAETARRRMRRVVLPTVDFCPHLRLVVQRCVLLIPASVSQKLLLPRIILVSDANTFCARIDMCLQFAS